MAAIDQFAINLEAAGSLVSMYRELRHARGLGVRGRLSAANLDLLWMPRSAVVASVSALDAYVHAVVYERLPLAFGQMAPPPDELCERLASLVPIKNSATFRAALPIFLANNSIDALLFRFKEEALAFQSFIEPEKIAKAYGLLGHANVFEEVSQLWPGPNTSSDDLKRRLHSYVRRRNQIAHEGDLEGNGTPRPIQPEYARDCRDFINSLVERLNQIVYGV